MGSGENNAKTGNVKPPKEGKEPKQRKPEKGPDGGKDNKTAESKVPVLPPVSESETGASNVVSESSRASHTITRPTADWGDDDDAWPAYPPPGPPMWDPHRPVGYGYGVPGGMYAPPPPHCPPPDYFWQDQGADQEEGNDVQGPPQPMAVAHQNNPHEMSDSEEEGEVPDTDDGNLLADYQARYAEEVGPPVNEEISRVINAMWNRGKDSKVVKDLCAKYPRPENIKPQRVDINDEIISGIPKHTKTRDYQLRAAQQSLARAVVPAVANVTMLMQNTALNRQTLLNQSMDSMIILGHANAQLNQIRRDLLKPAIQPRYQSLCRPRPEVDTSKLLFGENLPERIKNATQGGKISRKAMRGAYGNPTNRRYAPYAFHGYGHNSYNRGGYSSYSSRGRGRPFLGKFQSVIGGHDYKFECKQQMYTSGTQSIVCHDVVQQLSNTQISLVDCFRPEQRGGLQQGLRTGTEGHQVNDMDTVTVTQHGEVGEYNLPAIIEKSQWPVFVGGRVSQCALSWSKLTKDWKMLSQLRGLCLEFENGLPVQTFIPKPLRFSEQELVFLRSEIASLLEKQVIVEVDHVEGEFISQVFLREKRTPGKYRMILNLKKLNLNMEKIHFKMDTLLSTLAMIEPGMKMLSVDFSDAYYSLAVAPHHRKYLRFEFEGKLYEFKVVPMGLTLAPRFFTKVLKIPLSHMREKGIIIAGYLDDQILMAYSDQEAIEAGTYAAKLFEDLGFTINIEKSVTKPTSIIEHLGFIINSDSMTVTMTDDKVNKIMKLAQECLHSNKLPIRQVAKLIGKFNATRPANVWAGLYSKQLEIDKNLALAGSKYDFEALMEISDSAKVDIQWWLHNLPRLTAPIRTPKPDFVLFTDASLEGWGGHNPQSGQSCGGRWDLNEAKHHINYLELKAVWLSLFSFCRDLKDLHIRIMSDNTTTVACINKQGSTQSFNCNNMARHIWDFAVARNIWLSAAHCPGVLNTEADLASRVFKDETEWTLNQNVFVQICKLLGKPTIDLFASRLNCKVKPYCAWQPDPEAIFIDALLFDWTEYYFYAFPPFSIIHLVLQKIMQEKAEGIVVVPWWPTKPWFTQFANMICADPLVIHVTDQTLFLPFSLRTHPLSGRLRLIVGTLSGDHSKSREFREQLYQRSLKGGENLRTNFTSHISGCGAAIVAQGVRIPLTQL